MMTAGEIITHQLIVKAADNKRASRILAKWERLQTNPPKPRKLKPKPKCDMLLLPNTEYSNRKIPPELIQKMLETQAKFGARIRRQQEKLAKKKEAAYRRAHPEHANDLLHLIGKMLEEPLTVNKNGKPCKVATAEVVAKKLVRRAMKSDMDAIEILYRRRFEQARNGDANIAEEIDEKRYLVLMPDNGRGALDPELAAALAETERQFYARKGRQLH